MGLGLGRLIDLSKKLKSNKNLLSAKSAKTRTAKRSRNINLKGRENSKNENCISEKKLNAIKKSIREQSRKERRNEYILAGIIFLTLKGIIIAIWILLKKPYAEIKRLKNKIALQAGTYLIS